ncbi:MAG: DUF1640 domain-containing protein [Magnetococcales bacterium]|nr:DUF1640 domain-containing protein [Magnetococcales bacterium]
MAYAIPFDTLAFVKELETAGVPPAQAEAQASALSKVLQKVEDARQDELATKGDVIRLERDIKELDAKMDARFREMDAKLKELELRMIIKLGTMMLALFGLMITANRLWPIQVEYVTAPHAAQEMRLPLPVRPEPPSVPPAPAR